MPSHNQTRSEFKPVRFDPSLERLEPDERQTASEISATLRSIIEKTFADSGHAFRSVHAKSHALLQGQLEGLPGLDETLAQGLFSKPATYPVVIRISTNPGDILPDDVSLPRGLALKVIGIKGETGSGLETAPTQDFVMVNGPAFLAPTAKAFSKNLKLLAKTTDTATSVKEALSTALRGLEKVVELTGNKSATLISLGGHPMTHPLGETYFSQTPFRYGDYIAKFSLSPTAAALTNLTNAALNVKGKPDGIRQAMLQYFSNHGGAWDLKVQLCTDLVKMPIEDSTVPWSEKLSPYLTVAKISVPVQSAWSDQRSSAIDDNMAFSPWHCLDAHQPLGSINRVRKTAYQASSELRGLKTGCPMIHEPVKAAHFTD